MDAPLDASQVRADMRALDGLAEKPGAEVWVRDADQCDGTLLQAHAVQELEPALPAQLQALLYRLLGAFAVGLLQLGLVLLDLLLQLAELPQAARDGRAVAALRLKGASSCAMRSTVSRRPAARKRISQGASRGRWRQRIESGLMGSSSIPGTFFQSPGREVGTTPTAEIEPALPKEVPLPGSRGS